MSRPAAFHDLPAEAFPLTITFTDADTAEELHTITLDGPGVLDIPGWAPRRVAVDLVLATGENSHMEPPA